MKKQNLNALRLNKQKISQFERSRVSGGMVSTAEKCYTYMKESVGDWCKYSEYASCYSPCGGMNGTSGCNPG
ncbi:hypothetical protein U8527_04160 [Kordia algicida OT-1]|uniref:Uncharacterized protein n=1 Tax=Kordia algicida OT-1 TaxID=391587 RepID=A9DPT5_9FLAO|nr:hypothetical protein [Kordia algicida]EDP97515.1 hypothetical protein KAOT1_20172 [Kordia algicida OT-1]